MHPRFLKPYPDKRNYEIYSITSYARLYPRFSIDSSVLPSFDFDIKNKAFGNNV